MRRGEPANSISDTASTSAPSSALSSARPRKAPRQEAGPVPERHVFVRGARHLELVRGVELPLIEVGGKVPHRHDVAGVNPRTAQLQIRGSGTGEVHRWGGPPQHLLDRGVDRHGTVTHASPLVGEVSKRFDRADRRYPGGLIAAKDQAVAVERDILDGQLLAPDSGGGDHCYHVVTGVGPALRSQVGEVPKNLVTGLQGGERVSVHLVGGEGVLVPPQ